MNIHPNTPPKLVKQFKQTGSYHKLAEQIDVNVKYVYELITQGREPNDTTPTLREIRHRLGLRKYKRRHSARKPQSETQKAIRQMVKQTKQAIS